MRGIKLRQVEGPRSRLTTALVWKEIGSALSAGWTQIRSVVESPTLLIGAIVVTGGFLVRIWGIDFGLPYRYHIDEQGWIAYGGLLCSGQFDFPSWTAGPNLLHVLICGVDAVVFLGGLAAGAWESVAGFRAAYDADPTAIYLAGRTLSALFGTATLILVFETGRRLWNRTVGLIAMSMLAFTFLHTRDSHFVVSDILVTFLLMLSLLLVSAFLAGRNQRWLMGAALVSGLAAGAKFTLALGFIPVIAGLTLAAASEGHRGQPRIAAPVGMFLKLVAAFSIGFVAAYPNLLKVFVDSGELVEDFVSEWRAAKLRASLWEVDSLPAGLFYLKALSRGMGVPLLLVALVGTGLAVWKRTPKDLLLLSFLIPFYGFLSTRGYYTAHYVIPMLPVAVLLAARFLHILFGILEWSGNAKGWALALSTVVILSPSLVSIVQFNSLLIKEDTRTITKQWIEANIPEGSRIATSLYTTWEPPLSSSSNLLPGSTTEYELVTLGGLGGLSDAGFESLRENSVDYVVVSSYVYEISLRDPVRRQTRERFFEQLLAEGTRVFHINPVAEGASVGFEYDQVYGPWNGLGKHTHPGPKLEVFRLW